MSQKDDAMHDEEMPGDRSWGAKFRRAFRGAELGIRGQSSFFVHFFTAAAVIAAGTILRVNRIEWCILLLCITIVLTAEMFNSALEHMARAITHQPNPHLGGALDIGSAAVLTASVGASIIGFIVLGRKLAMLAGWW